MDVRPNLLQALSEHLSGQLDVSKIQVIPYGLAQDAFDWFAQQNNLVTLQICMIAERRLNR